MLKFQPCSECKRLTFHSAYVILSGKFVFCRRERKMTQMSTVKTNAVRLLDHAEIPYQLFQYDITDGKLDAISMAAKMQADPDTVFKTLVTVNQNKEYFVFVIPGPASLDLKKAAKVSGSKSIEMILQKNLLPLTGYIHGGCSPIGMKKRFPTFIDETAQLFDSIRVSAGKIGFCISISPEALKNYIDASFADLTV